MIVKCNKIQTKALNVDNKYIYHSSTNYSGSLLIMLNFFSLVFIYIYTAMV